MTEPAPTTGRTVLVFAPPEATATTALMEALQGVQAGPELVNQVALGLGRLCHRPPGVPPPTAVIILGAMSGLPVSAIARAVRGLPGLSEVPLIITSDAPLDLPRCATCAPPVDTAAICRLATTDAAAWPAPGAAASPAGEEVFDPVPLRRFDQMSPGTSRDVILALRKDLQLTTERIPGLLAIGDLDALAKVAHKLKGSSGSVGAVELARLCSQLERVAKAGDAAASRSAAEAVPPAIARLEERLSAFSAGPPAP